MGDWKLVDTMIIDGLWDVYNQYHMGITAENVAKKYGITREQQDALALASQQKAAAAQEAGRFKDEIVPVLDRAEEGRPDRLRRRRVHQQEDQRRSAGRPAPRLRQGRRRDRRQCVGPQRRRRRGGGDEREEGRAARPASRWRASPATPPSRSTRPSWAWARCRRRQKALQRAGWKPADLDLLEINEAFAAQACAVNKEMGWDTSKVNVNGGAIAIGHPIGASGCRILVTLLHEMQRRGAKKGIASLCIGGGMGVALAVERCWSAQA